MKTHQSLTLLAVFILLTISLKAQPPAFRADLNRMFANQYLQTQMQIQMQMNMAMMGRYYDYIPDNFKYDFKVRLKDSTTKEVYSKIYLDTIRHQNYLLFEDKKLPKKDSLRKQRIYPGETISISRDGIVPFNKLTYTANGIAKDSCWMFKVIGGARINVFSFLSAREGGDFSHVTVVAIQKGDGPIVKLSAENVTAMVAGDDDALKAIEKKNYLKAIKIYNKNFLKANKTTEGGARQ
ncbi:hypothetical protein [Mucilaginibacter psychrotolerans]|uniref:GLPGLI family protein n=1 Tax=Mucilaginibacter psychrotolerans TaxID=1524096 RepID=A0A4Y8SM59_9SPHI|nr:hypothetical protein [Mucilaginibacter psychrotolerans]TFF39554.1 hypothetical protein E2R66_04055 [Mucilaginibacter psychrotolerans]